MPLTLKQRYIIALENAGYRRHQNPRGGKYFEMTYQGEAGGTGLYKGEHRILVGDAGGLRVTRGSVADSTPVDDSLKETMLAAVPDDLRQAKRDYPNSVAFAAKKIKRPRRF
jgi:hypothetical protein